jgi:hypothetical protein
MLQKKSALRSIGYPVRVCLYPKDAPAMPTDPITEQTLQDELAHLVTLRNARTDARSAVSSAQAATSQAQSNEANAITAEATASQAVNDARDQFLQDLQSFANAP